MCFAHIVLQHDKEPSQATGDMHLGSRFLYLTMRGSVYCLWGRKVYIEYITIRIMNYNTHSNIRAAIKRAETINVRDEVSIPLYRLKEELERQRIQKQDFEQYLLRYISPLDRPYIEEIVPILFGDVNNAIIDRKETFKITSGLR